MKTILSLLFIFVITFSFAQNIEEWGVPYNEDEESIIYENVVSVDGISKDELYQRALDWINNYYTNADRKISEKDKNKGVIKLKDRIVTYSETKKGKEKDAMVDYKWKFT
jgi:hypothetical protein